MGVQWALARVLLDLARPNKDPIPRTLWLKGPQVNAISDELAHRLTLWSGYGLTTAEILYRLPDHPRLLQSYIWQGYDSTPRFPALNTFLAFWRRSLDGALHSVKVGHATLVTPVDLRMVGTEYRLH